MPAHNKQNQRNKETNQPPKPVTLKLKGHQVLAYDLPDYSVVEINNGDLEIQGDVGRSCSVILNAELPQSFNISIKGEVKTGCQLMNLHGAIQAGDIGSDANLIASGPITVNKVGQRCHFTSKHETFKATSAGSHCSVWAKTGIHIKNRVGMCASLMTPKGHIETGSALNNSAFIAPNGQANVLNANVLRKSGHCQLTDAREPQKEETIKEAPKSQSSHQQIMQHQQSKRNERYTKRKNHATSHQTDKSIHSEPQQGQMTNKSSHGYTTAYTSTSSSPQGKSHPEGNLAMIISDRWFLCSNPKLKNTTQSEHTPPHNGSKKGAITPGSC